MRKILFRGKRLDNGKWVYGFYAIDADGHYIINDNGDIEQDEPHIGEWLKIDPETLGQHIELYDKNWKNIFDGDIVKNEYGRIGEVVYHNIDPFHNGVRAEGKCGVYGLEVIGNIHDNPELLKKDDYCEKCGSKFVLRDRVWRSGEKELCPICADSEIPDYETVEEWEERTKREYPITAPIYALDDKCWDKPYYFLTTKEIVDKSRQILIVANELGKPPNDWRPR